MDKLLSVIDNDSDFVDDKLGKIEVGSMFYVKSTEKIVVVIDKSMFLDVIELFTGEVHDGVEGYCYNNNLIRLPCACNTEILHEIIQRKKKGVPNG